MRTPTFLSIIATGIAAFTGPLAGQGALAPPGAPGPTQKTLQQVEPRVDLQAGLPGPGVSSDAGDDYVIYDEGSYYLTSDLYVTKATGIDIRGNNVTLDLNGFSIQCRVGTATTGIKIEGSATQCEVKNGKIYSFTAGFSSSASADGIVQISGIDTTDTTLKFCDLTVSKCTNAMNLTGTALLEGCRLEANDQYGVTSTAGLICVNCTANSNNNAGFYTSSFCSMTGCGAYHTNVDGFGGANGSFENCTAIGNGNGFNLTSSCTATNCTSAGSVGPGFTCGAGGSFTNCTSKSNVGAGFSVGIGSVVTGCVARLNNGTGIQMSDGATANGCVVSSNKSDGIDTGVSASISNCTCSANVGVGISVGDRGTVKDCTVTSSTGDAILATNNASLSGNNLSANGTTSNTTGAGIHVTGVDGRIEGNTLSDNAGYGIRVDGTRNFVVRNFARTNHLNYQIVAGNRVAKVVAPDVTAADINGANSGDPNGFSAIDPWANISY